MRKSKIKRLVPYPIVSSFTSPPTFFFANNIFPMIAYPIYCFTCTATLLLPATLINKDQTISPRFTPTTGYRDAYLTKLNSVGRLDWKNFFIRLTEPMNLLSEKIMREGK